MFLKGKPERFINEDTRLSLVGNFYEATTWALLRAGPFWDRGEGSFRGFGPLDCVTQATVGMPYEDCRTCSIHTGT